MLESGDVLRTWRLLPAPALECEVTAQPLGDHRTLYLDYEGPVSGNRGSVQRWDTGTYDIVAESSDRVCMRLRGRRLSGTSVLQKDRHGRWVFSCQADTAG